MDNIFKIQIGVDVATFLYNTSRILKAIEVFNECLVLFNDKETIKERVTPTVIIVYDKLLGGYSRIQDHTSAIECGKKLRVMLHENGYKEQEGVTLIKLGNICCQTNKHDEAKKFYEKALSIMIEVGNNREVTKCYENLGQVFLALCQYTKAEEYLQKALVINKEIGDKEREASDYGNLGTVFQSVGQYTKAEEYLQKALVIRKQIGDKEGEASDYGNLGTVFQFVGQYTKAEEYLQKAVTTSEEIGDIAGLATSYRKLGTLFISVSQYSKAKEYLQRALTINKGFGNKAGQAACYVNLANVLLSVGQHTKAKEYLQKALTFNKEIGNKAGEASAYGILGALFESVGQYAKAEEYLQKALVMRKEIGDKSGEASDYGNLGTVFLSVGQYTKAEEYLRKALVISKEIGDKEGEASAYGNLGTVFQSVGQYTKAEEYLQKALVIRKEIGDKKGEASAYGNLGTVFLSVGQYTKAEEYFQKALVIRKEIGDKQGEATDYGNLGNVSESVGQYTKAEEYLQKALVIMKEIGDKRGEASSYANLGTVFLSLCQYAQAEEYHQNALMISEEIGDKKGVGASHLNLGEVFRQVHQFTKSQEFAKKALEISREIGDIEMQFHSHLTVAWNTLVIGGNISEVMRNLYESVQKCEKVHDFLRGKEQFKISFFDEHVSPYLLLSRFFILSGNYCNALYVAELGRSRALADVLSDRYSVKKEVSVNPQSWIGIENVMDKNALSSCVYVSCFGDDMDFWILKPNKNITFRQTRLKERAEKVFGSQTVGGSFDLRQDQCEDRSLFSSSVSSLPSWKPSQDESSTVLRHREEDDETQEARPPTLADLYNIIIAPVADLLQEPEIIIIPDGLLYPIPFAAVTDDNGKYLSDTFKIRIVPSLTTLKLIQLSPTDYHSKTGALIVGEPDVSVVYYQGKRRLLSPLPGARKEAEMIGQLLGVQPLLGRDATKQAVLENIHSVSLIHFAAHGDAKRGEIALSPISSRGTPHEEDYLLTMAEILQVRLTAKLVVLSCCNSAGGQIRAEGVVGIARAFLASGARAVLAALWAVEDKATMFFMNCFYEHLVHGESASESLHQAMKSMGENSFSEVKHWAPFMLIGDDVTFRGLYLITFLCFLAVLSQNM